MRPTGFCACFWRSFFDQHGAIAIFEEGRIEVLRLGLKDVPGWGDAWRDGVYDYLHFHSRIHEVMGVCRGHGRQVAVRWQTRPQAAGQEGRCDCSCRLAPVINAFRRAKTFSSSALMPAKSVQRFTLAEQERLRPYPSSVTQS